MFRPQKNELSVCCLPPIHVSTLVKIVAILSFLAALLSYFGFFIVKWWAVILPTIFVIVSILLFVGANKNDTSLFWPYMIVNVLFILYMIADIIFFIIAIVYLFTGRPFSFIDCSDVEAMKIMLPVGLVLSVASLLITMWCQYVVLKGYQYIEERKRNGVIEPVREHYAQDIPRVVEEVVNYPRTYIHDPVRPHTGHV